jgi:hypothetical protein
MRAKIKKVEPQEPGIVEPTLDINALIGKETTDADLQGLLDLPKDLAGEPFPTDEEAGRSNPMFEPQVLVVQKIHDSINGMKGGLQDGFNALMDNLKYILASVDEISKKIEIQGKVIEKILERMEPPRTTTVKKAAKEEIQEPAKVGEVITKKDDDAKAALLILSQVGQALSARGTPLDHSNKGLVGNYIKNIIATKNFTCEVDDVLALL